MEKDLDPTQMKQASHRSTSQHMKLERDELDKKEVVIAAKAVLIPEYGIKGKCINSHNNNMEQYNDYICPNS